ncbi:tumor necrosis factor receptor superfamily member 16-like [Ruditapes philippinarum]|uniref:tumor necrosis factor receptor superfamily member 16-like n=1 Tax=Ruditapes philippinarum TaxID=129788 RepID=UPI00295B17EC|nr:tumor necrosis factor receptor superfamily member 16-like [Ruditapes philippinarum]
MEMRHTDVLGRSVNVVHLGLLILLGQMAVCYSQCSDNQIEVGFNETVTKCCDTCKTGTGVSVQCSPSENTQCQKCIPGKTYSDSNSFEEPCKQCSTCGNNSHFILHPCNETQNTICVCPDGSYYDPVSDQCKYCFLCHPGRGAVTKCGSTNNTVCGECGNGTYSNKLDSFSKCTPCTICKETEVALKECTPSEDRICFSMHAGGVEPRYNSSTPIVYTHDDDDDGDVIPIYCSVLGLVVVGLLCYVVIKHWRRMRAKRRHKAPCSHEDVEYSKASGGDSGIFVDNESPKNYSYCLTSRVRDLPISKRTELEKILSSPQSDSWKMLAKELGYSNKRMEQFESKKKNDTNSSFKHMLHDWERRDIAIVSHLLQCLRNIGREDAARILYLDSTEGRTQLLVKQQQQNHVV